MIKPFKILSTRDEVDGTTVFFRVSRTEQIDETKSKTKVMETAVHVNTGEDIDEVIFNNLKDTGWI